MPVELSKQEETVLSTVREYLNKNRYFNINDILPFIHARFKMASININLRGIEDILRGLVKKKLLIEGSKLTKDDILTNKKRKQIYLFIVENPGTYFNKIVKSLAMSNHIVIWHLSMLLKFNYIKSEMIDNHQIFFEVKFNLKNVKVNYFTSKEKSKLIIKYLKNNDLGITKTKLSSDLNIHINTAKKYLDFLENFNVVTRKNLSNKILYFLNEDFIESSF
ncbi:MAG: hypothetical protein ACFFDB_07665 [Promethearchaeota archaeon]